MMHFEKSGKEMVKPVALSLSTAAVGALSVFEMVKWNQWTVDQSPFVSNEIPVSQTPTEQVNGPLLAGNPTRLVTLVVYPDPLLARLLPTAIYPLEAVQAARWRQANPDTDKPSGQDYAPSIVVLLLCFLAMGLFMRGQRIQRAVFGFVYNLLIPDGKQTIN